MKQVGIDYDSLEVGRELGSSVDFVTQASILDYARAVEDLDPVYFDLEAARAAGYDNMVAPAGYHLRYSAMKWATGQAGYVPQGSVHIRQQHKLMGLAYVGDCLTTTVSIAEKYEKKGHQYVAYQIQIANQQGKIICISNFINMLP